MDNSVKIIQYLSVKIADLHHQIVETSGEPLADDQALAILHLLKEMHEKLSLSLSIVADLYAGGKRSKH